MSVSLSRLQAFYGHLEALPLLRVMIKEEFSGHIAVNSSFGADTAVLLALVAQVDRNTPIIFLETGKHFQATLSYAELLREQLGLRNIEYVRPDPILLGRIDPDGMLWKTQPNRCCWLRKVEPLARVLQDMNIEAVITGRKRYQTPERAAMQSIELDDKGRFRINPLASWTREQITDTFAQMKLPPHPLLANGYLSIGCEPCTAPVGAGQDERAGRWAHTIGIEDEQKTECGIHLPESEQPSWDL